MSVDSGWVQFWETVLIAGLGSYFLLVLAVIPLGALDVLRLFRVLDETDESD